MSKTAYISNTHLELLLNQAIEAAAKKPIPSGNNSGYECGKVLGIVEGLKAAKELIQTLGDELMPGE